MSRRMDESFYQQATINTLIDLGLQFLTFESLGFYGVTPDVIIVNECSSNEVFWKHEALVLEIKKRLSYEYLGQLLRYKKLFGVVYLVVPSEEISSLEKSPEEFTYKRDLIHMLEELGIGLILINVKKRHSNNNVEYFVSFEKKIDVKPCFVSELLIKHFAYLYSLKKLLDIVINDTYISLYNAFRAFIKKHCSIRIFSRSEMIDEVFKNIFCPLKPSLELNRIIVEVSENPQRYVLIDPEKLIKHDLRELVRYLLGRNPLSNVLEENVSEINKYTLKECLFKLPPSLILYIKYTKPYITYDEVLKILRRSIFPRFIKLKGSLG